ncbi:MAG: redoxin domain-containing protein [Armatimonadetes bacterium]|nr:redoxin domain-containing protein [Armatimonadota bacterium]
MSPRLSLAAVLLSVGAMSVGVAAPPIPKKAAAARAISPQARALLTQMVAAEKGLTSYAGTISITDMAGPGQSRRSQVALKVKKPNLAAVTVSSGGTPMAQAVADGSTLALVDFGQKKYVQQPVTGAAGPAQALEAGQSALASFTLHPESVSQIITGARTQSVMVGPADVSGSETLQNVVARLQMQPGVVETITFGIGQADHLLHSLAFNVSLPGHTVSHTEAFTDFQAGPALTAADFTFTPPAGLDKVASAEDMQPPMYDPRLKVGAAPLTITASDLAGKPVSLDDYKGKVVLLDFWATWCGPCVGEMPNVVAAYDKYHPQGFEIVGISLDQPNSRAALTSFTQQHHMPWRQIYDGGYWQSKVPQQYGVQAIPFSLLIGKDGKIAAVDPRGPALAPAVRSALAQK